jgi:hypothetical protein
MNDTKPRKSNQYFRIRLGLIVLILGYLMFVLGVDPAFFGMDRSTVFGFVQITVFLVGLALICIGGYVIINALWNSRQKSILADIGIRLVATGYVIAVASGLADIFGLGSHPFPNIPSFGGVQIIGVILGEATIMLGFIITIPDPRKSKETIQNE